ncbi:ankyrin repeat domain-containing protein [Metapseudomonas otitidis]|uniref:ankyrin repeat domain-containing protein n=1 Tax=Metapseudomonas otitidis TaxID=319939 RepID=UPI003A86ACDA
MRFTPLLCLPLMLLLGATQAAEEPARPALPWFTPVLVEGKAALCDEAIKAAKAHFLSPKRWASFELPGAEHVQPWGDDLADAKGPIHVQVYTHSGCGSACERYQYVASRGPEPSREHLEAMAKGSPAPAADIALFKGADKQLFSIASGIDGEPDTVEINRLNDDLTWTACRISTAPAADRVADIVPAELRASVRALSARTSNMRQGTGSWCGSLRTHERWSERIGARLQEVYYRPWAVRDDAGDSYGSYEQDLSNLQIWAATGVAEHKAYLVFLQQMTSSQAAMAAFYKRRFGWSDGQARTMARQALEGAISSGIRFYMYEPFPKDETALRNAILAHRPMDEIRAIEGQVRDLSIAIEYPEALAYLIEQGADVNQANAFGKTALMYAAHYNQLESARILLARGAYPNAVTVLPEDDCYYTITTRNMTALHYAARYASPALVRLLVDNGAEPFIQAHREGEEGSTPLDWLHQYTAANAEEPNPNIDPDQVAEVEALLQPPTDEALRARAKRLVLEGEKAYGAGDLKQALRTLNLAINIQPHNERALSDLSLVALRDGDLGVSLQAGQALIDSSKDARLLANAWFNQGLACDASDSSWPFYNGTRYCDASAVYAYYQALAAHRTEARAAKLLQALQAVPDVEVHRFLFEGSEVRMVQRYGPDHSSLYLYLLHPRGLVIPTERIGWTLSSESKGIREITPSSVGREVLDDDWALTVLRRDARVDVGSLHIRPATSGSGAL